MCYHWHIFSVRWGPCLHSDVLSLTWSLGATVEQPPKSEYHCSLVFLHDLGDDHYDQDRLYHHYADKNIALLQIIFSSLLDLVILFSTSSNTYQLLIELSWLSMTWGTLKQTQRLKGSVKMTMTQEMAVRSQPQRPIPVSTSSPKRWENWRMFQSISPWQSYRSS